MNAFFILLFNYLVFVVFVCLSIVEFESQAGFTVCFVFVDEMFLKREKTLWNMLQQQTQRGVLRQKHKSQWTRIINKSIK